MPAAPAAAAAAAARWPGRTHPLASFPCTALMAQPAGCTPKNQSIGPATWRTALKQAHLYHPTGALCTPRELAQLPAHLARTGALACRLRPTLARRRACQPLGRLCGRRATMPSGRSWLPEPSARTARLPQRQAHTTEPPRLPPCTPPPPPPPHHRLYRKLTILMPASMDGLALPPRPSGWHFLVSNMSGLSHLDLAALKSWPGGHRRMLVVCLMQEM